ncbi:MAG: YicC family protein [Brevinematales bacterium]|nr:YicC family protein [Brevinematales bacterium]
MRSMTGFSYISKETRYGKVTIYVRCLNSRFLEIKTQIPSYLNTLEERTRKIIKQEFRRGKIEIIVDFFPTNGSFDIFVDKELAKNYFVSLRDLSNYLGLLPDIEIVDIAQMPNVINLVKSNIPKDFIVHFEKLFRKVIHDINKQRSHEGENIKRDCLFLVSSIKDNIRLITNRWNEVNVAIESKIKEKVEKFLKDYENRKEIDTSILSFIMKIDINEEIFRFNQHLSDLEKMLIDGGEVGKKIEFLLQELNREVNTIASKSFDYKISSLVVEIKSSLEKIKEHIQNVE